MVVHLHSSSKSYKNSRKGYGGKKATGNASTGRGISVNVRLPDGSITSWKPKTENSQYKISSLPRIKEKVIVKLPGYSVENGPSSESPEAILDPTVDVTVRSSSSLSSASSLMSSDEVYTPSNSRSTTPLDRDVNTVDIKTTFDSSQRSHPHPIIVDSTTTSNLGNSNSLRSTNPYTDPNRYYFANHHLPQRHHQPQQQNYADTSPYYYYYYPTNLGSMAMPYYDTPIYGMVAPHPADMSLMPIMIQPQFMFVPSDAQYYPTTPVYDQSFAYPLAPHAYNQN